MTHVLAIDLGASGGRVIRGSWDAKEKKLSLHEIHRFDNVPVEVRGTLYWDILRLFHEIKTGIRQAVRTLPEGEVVASLGIDTWGVDFGLLDASGQLLGNPIHYRDSRTDGEVDRLSSLLGEGTLFRQTGIQDAWFNTVYQLTGALKKDAGYFLKAQTLLFTPDLLNYFFTGIKAAERTIASTSQLLVAGTTVWADELFTRLKLPRSLMQTVVEPGTLLGPVTPELAADLGLKPGTPVAVVPSHDTESAALAVPAKTQPGHSFVFVSCGTWSVMGAELTAPVLSDAARKAGFSNEAGSDGTNLLLRNIMGMWLLQECKRWWERDGVALDHGALVDLAATAPAWKHHIDVNHSLFATPGDMPSRIQAYCQTTGQPVPADRAAILRCVLESLACVFRQSLAEMETMAGFQADELWLVGGGARNKLLCAVTATVTGRLVKTGPAETTALGNIGSQFKALGLFASTSDVRQAIGESFGTGIYEPRPDGLSEAAYARWSHIVVHAPKEMSGLVSK